MKCKKCGNDYEGNFCPECGTPAEIVPKSNVKEATPTVTQVIPTNTPIPPVKTNAQTFSKKSTKPVYKKWWFWILIVLAFFIVVGFIGGNDDSSTASGTTGSTHLQETNKSQETTKAPGTTKASKAPATTKSQVNEDANSGQTIGQKNALKQAKSYLSYSAFSYKGLIEQLEFEKFSNADAVYAADNCGADWNEQAAKKAASYLSYSAFSRDSLIEQLEFEGFTNAQAVYGAEANGY